MYSRFHSPYSYSAYPAPQKYKEDIQCIVDPIDKVGGIYVGNLEAAQNIHTLKRLNIKAILTAAKGVFLSHPKSQVSNTKYVPADDIETFNLSPYFDESADWIEQNLKTTNILVHCMAGVSRSVSLLLAYLIKYKQMKYHQAHDFVKKRRNIIYPNSGFIKQLRQYQLKNKNDIQRERTPQPKQRSFSPSPNDYKNLTTPTLQKYGKNNRYSELYESPITTKRGYSSSRYQKLSTSNKVADAELDKRIQEIRKKYSNNSEYIPSRTHTRQHSTSYKQTKPRNSYLDRTSITSKYLNSEYKAPTYGERYDRMRNPQVYGGRLFSNYIFSRGY